MIQDVEKMIQAALGQIESILDIKSVVGAPVTVGDYTIVPLISIPKFQAVLAELGLLAIIIFMLAWAIKLLRSTKPQ